MGFHIFQIEAASLQGHDMRKMMQSAPRAMAKLAYISLPV
jgi:hypothetical protein